jgi:hypothetical protein
MVTGLIKALGACFMLAAPGVAFDVGGFVSAIGIGDPLVQKILGGALFVTGLVDFLFVPALLNRLVDRGPGA